MPRLAVIKMIPGGLSNWWIQGTFTECKQCKGLFKSLVLKLTDSFSFFRLDAPPTFMTPGNVDREGYNNFPSIPYYKPKKIQDP